MQKREVHILGEAWSLYIGNQTEFPELKTCDGYTDKTSRCMVILEKPEESNLEFYERYQKKVIRHEIIHAFLFASGLHSSARFEAAENEEHPEMMVDWMAVQFPKILKAFREAGAFEEGDAV